MGAPPAGAELARGRTRPLVLQAPLPVCSPASALPRGPVGGRGEHLLRAKPEGIVPPPQAPGAPTPAGRGRDKGAPTSAPGRPFAPTQLFPIQARSPAAPPAACALDGAAGPREPDPEGPAAWEEAWPGSSGLQRSPASPAPSRILLRDPPLGPHAAPTAQSITLLWASGPLPHPRAQGHICCQRPQLCLWPAFILGLQNQKGQAARCHLQSSWHLGSLPFPLPTPHPCFPPLTPLPSSEQHGLWLPPPAPLIWMGSWPPPWVPTPSHLH